MILSYVFIFDGFSMLLITGRNHSSRYRQTPDNKSDISFRYVLLTYTESKVCVRLNDGQLVFIISDKCRR